MYHWHVARTCNRYEWYTPRSALPGQSTVPGVLLCLATVRVIDEPTAMRLPALTDCARTVPAFTESSTLSLRLALSSKPSSVELALLKDRPVRSGTVTFETWVGDAGAMTPPEVGGMKDGVGAVEARVAGEADRVGELDGPVAAAAADATNSVSAVALTAIFDRVPSFDAQAQIGTITIHPRSEEHTSELQSRLHLVCRLL